MKENDNIPENNVDCSPPPGNELVEPLFLHNFKFEKLEVNAHKIKLTTTA
jgi:hypothetical protein